MCRCSELVARVRAWQLTDQTFATLDEFLELTGYRTEPSAQSDELLGRLVRVAGSDPIASRIVLQRILPGLLAIVKVEQNHNPRVDAFDQLIGEAWISIARYDVDTRPTNIAARILHDARHRAFTNGRRRRVVDEVTCDSQMLNEMVMPITVSPFDELVQLIGEAKRRGLKSDAINTVGDVLAYGTAVKVAEAREVTTRAVRYRQHQAITQIRRLVAA